MADQTGIDPDSLRAAAKRIDGIMSDDVMTVFQGLKDQPPTAGGFPTATWLHDRVADRVTAVQQQAQILKTAFTDICTGLNNVADDLQGTDRNNGEKLRQDFDAIGSKVATDSSSIGTKK
ncbi:hypothetical protein [Amycolatopsis pigmentata]|uniref:Excreted virulence factor EspC (Type VII ESX diderm) n=1 Tax=Amycolatopsis pigmentata TaxID=450801 RepID=A0ABW5G034_9PSEU